MTPSRDISRLLEIMAALRTRDVGCPWDLEQNFASIAPYTIEEAYEVVDAIARGDLEDLCDELGDLLLQVVFHARIGREGHVGTHQGGGEGRARGAAAARKSRAHIAAGRRQGGTAGVVARNG